MTTPEEFVADVERYMSKRGAEGLGDLDLSEYFAHMMASTRDMGATLLKPRDEKALKDFTIFPWLPSYSRVMSPARKPLTGPHIKLDYHTVFEVVRTDCQMAAIWNLMSLATPKILNKYFHNINMMMLLTRPKVDISKIVMVLSYHALFKELFGFHYYKLVHQLAQKFEACTSANPKTLRKKRKALTDECKYLLASAIVVHSVFNVPYSPGDLCDVAKDFLLEPGILIQLPWVPTLLHQWLTAALAEVTIFEMESHELCLWPLPRSAFLCASEVVELVRHLKERIVIGIWLFSDMVHVYPDTNPEHPKLLMDIVVLPSLPILEYLVTGQATKIVKGLKKSCWGEPKKLEKGNLMAPSQYVMSSDLDIYFYSSSGWHVQSFLHTGSYDPFQSSTSIELQKLIKNLRTDKFDLFVINWENVEWSMMSKKVTDKLTLDQKAELAVCVIKDQIINKNLLPGLQLPAVRELLTIPPKTVSKELFSKKNIASLLPSPTNVLMEALEYSVIYKNLLELDKVEPSILSQLVVLQLLRAERQCIVRLIYYLSELLNLPLHIKEASSFGSINISNTAAKLVNMKLEMKQQSREHLFTALVPQNWLGGIIDPKKKPLNFMSRLGEDGYPDVLLDYVENRLGNLLRHIAQESFARCSVKGGTVFPHWSKVQYVLPCYILDLFYQLRQYHSSHKKMENKKYLANYVILVLEALKHFEDAYVAWWNGVQPPRKKIFGHPNPSDRKAFGLYLAEVAMFRTNMEVRVECLIISYTAQEDLTKSDLRSNKALVGLIMTPSNFIITELLKSSCFFSFLPCVRAMIDYIIEVPGIFLDICIKAWKVPGPDIVIRHCPVLQEIYFANIVMFELESVVTMAAYFIQDDQVDTMINDINTSKVTYTKFMACINRAVFEAADTSAEDLKQIVESRRKMMEKRYQLVKAFRRKYKIERIPFYQKVLEDTCHPDVRNAVALFLSGNFMELEKMLKFFKLKVSGPECRQCGKAKSKMITCQKCLDEKYPDVNYFCSEECQKSRWREEHMAEHLEFELTVSDFVRPNTDE